MNALADQPIVSCGPNTSPLIGEAANSLLKQLDSRWIVVESHHLERHFQFENFQKALAYTLDVGTLAEEVDHHPEIVLTWGRVIIKIWTHTVEGLSNGDFVFAARCDRIYNKAKLSQK